MRTRDLVFPFFLFASFLIASSTMFAFVDKPSYLIPLFVFFFMYDILVIHKILNFV